MLQAPRRVFLEGLDITVSATDDGYKKFCDDGVKNSGKSLPWGLSALSNTLTEERPTIVKHAPAVLYARPEHIAEAPRGLRGGVEFGTDRAALAQVKPGDLRPLRREGKPDGAHHSVLGH